MILREGACTIRIVHYMFHYLAVLRKQQAPLSASKSARRRLAAGHLYTTFLTP
jgi:hypothetical protein